ncbi:MAG: ParB/RepB/Spo0J family partition protein [Treponema sp.]|nr:ParB/RepB/Spo0J family partition protein [Treponema sp.]
MAIKKGLGKGLEALLPGADANTAEAADSPVWRSPRGGQGTKSGEKSGDGVVLISPEKLIPNPGQPRKNFNEEELRELADSITEHGIIQPIIAADAGDGTYIIVAGERRTRAARLAGLNEVPVIIRKYTNHKQLEISLIENIQRTDLNPIEEAAAYKNLMDYSNLSQDEVAQRVGKNRSTVANSLRLLKLSADIQKSLEQGSISPGHARALLSVTGKKEKEKLYQDILSHGLSVREAEKRAALLNKAEEAKPAAPRDPELEAMQEKFINKLGTKVIIEGNFTKGRIHIDYFSMDDLERLYDIFCGSGK